MRDDMNKFLAPGTVMPGNFSPEQSAISTSISGATDQQPPNTRYESNSHDCPGQNSTKETGGGGVTKMSEIESDKSQSHNKLSGTIPPSTSYTNLNNSNREEAAKSTSSAVGKNKICTTQSTITTCDNIQKSSANNDTNIKADNKDSSVTTTSLTNSLTS